MFADLCFLESDAFVFSLVASLISSREILVIDSRDSHHAQFWFPLFTLLICAGISSAQGLNPLTPAKEYVRFNGQVVAIENPASNTSVWVDNSSFESGSLSPWTVQGGNASIDPTAAHSGAYGLKMGGSTTQSWVSQDINGLVPGQSYQASVWVRSSVAVANGALFYVHDASSQINNQVTAYFSPTTTWQQISLLFTATVSRTIRIHLVQLSGTTAETTYWDDVGLTIAPLNAGFESGILTPPWTIAGGNASVGSTAHSGMHGLTMGGVPNVQSWIYQDIVGLTPGQLYVVSVSVQSSSNTNSGVEIFLHDTAGNNAVDTHFQPLTSWQQFSTYFVATSNGKLRIHLVQDTGGSNFTYWDDVTVATLPNLRLCQSPRAAWWTREMRTAHLEDQSSVHSPLAISRSQVAVVESPLLLKRIPLT